MSAAREPRRERSKVGGSSTVRRSPRGRGGAGRKGFILTITDGRNAGREYFFETEASLGRTDENNVVIMDPGVSRRHARVSGAEGVFTIEDQGSSNGTRLNGERLATPEVLRDGDYLQIGETTILFSLLDVAHAEVTNRTTFAELEQAAGDRKFTSEQNYWQVRVRQVLRHKLTLPLTLAVLLLGGGWGVWAVLKSGKAGIVLDRSSEVIPYSDGDEFFNRVFGYGPYDRTHREKVQVEFDYLGGRTTLQYGAWGIDKVGEVQISVNGQRVGDIPLTMGRWVYGLKVVLPRKLLSKGTPNRVVFKNTLNPPQKDKWEICYVQLMQEAIPPANREEARLQFDLAKKAFEDREIAPNNLYTALGKFKKTRDLLEELPDKPEIYAEALQYIEKTDVLLTRKFQDALFDARRAERFNGVEAAKKVLRRALGFFGKEDFRYREIKRQLDAFET
jgi:pSer/pThr/pTyr-binding forkhead associated (FHA) protein